MPNCIILTTCATREQADKIAGGLVKKKLAACVQLSPVTSIYTWENEIHNEPEIKLTIKTRRDLYPRIEEYITAHHDYDVPQIIEIPIDRALAAYAQWIETETA